MDYDLHAVFSLVQHFRSLENLYIEVMLLTQIVNTYHAWCRTPFNNKKESHLHLYVMDKALYSHGQVLGQN